MVHIFRIQYDISTHKHHVIQWGNQHFPLLNFTLCPRAWGFLSSMCLYNVCEVIVSYRLTPTLCDARNLFLHSSSDWSPLSIFLCPPPTSPTWVWEPHDDQSTTWRTHQLHLFGERYDSVSGPFCCRKAVIVPRMKALPGHWWRQQILTQGSRLASSETVLLCVLTSMWTEFHSGPSQNSEVDFPGPLWELPKVTLGSPGST